MVAVADSVDSRAAVRATIAAACELDAPFTTMNVVKEAMSRRLGGGLYTTDGDNETPRALRRPAERRDLEWPQRETNRPTASTILTSSWTVVTPRATARCKERRAHTDSSLGALCVSTMRRMNALSSCGTRVPPT